jgi:arsenate reductase (thioredoxin)
MTPAPRVFVFACVHNAGRSQMAAAFFNDVADPTLARAVSAGTQPAAHVHPVVVAAMAKVGLDLASARPQQLTPELVAGAAALVTMGCGDSCPTAAGVRREDWPLPDPKDQPIERVRGVRDAVRAKVVDLVARESVARRSTR